ncbi:hypothetical protein DFJ58DRAFT_182730 [Suillus subalutaceus]|uniref:uncharacterized protein n=1 Tax=Suillus subalutaceus TaxID=48586 RepID=UPI001B86694A|nr:uncharacterized protein DFJ58DRAFT_182730 [Suillus subalutaceus]KAG1876637.1 hypothetical protein DFJ58DRAFT_182730 [Suillus subalutaceus]
MAEPKVDLASLSLFRATSAQTEESRRRTFPQWGGALSLTDFLARDATMESGEHAKDGKWITWVLAPRNDPTTLDFMSACETYKRTGLVAYPSSSPLESNSVHEATCYGVACVFTPPSKRRRGYANHMMSLLHWVNASRTNLPKFPEAWGAPPEEVADAGNGLFSVLYSDVGEEFYRSAGPGGKGGGWEKRGAISTIWEVGTEEGDDEGWKWLTEEQLNGLWERDAVRIRRELASIPTSDSSYKVERPAAFATYLPTDGVCGFHITKSTFASNFSMANGFWGVESTSDPGTYASWSVDLRPPPPTLIVTRLCASEELFPGLIAKIKQAARRSGIGKVEVWNLRVGLKEVAEKTGGRTSTRNEHLPQIVWYGPGTTGNVEWAYNEKFCWC